jgi:glycosyltransferase involved in cell wall biosynthesis
MGDASHTRPPHDSSPFVWMDVTQTAAVPMRAGIPRIVRGLYRELANLIPVLPAQWSEWPGWYGRVKPGSPEERRLVSGDVPTGTVPVFERLTRWGRSGRLGSAAFAPGSVWFVPEPFWEGRAAHWARRPGGAIRRVALFYDATPLSAGSEASARRRTRYVSYMKALAAFDCVIAISRESADDLLAFWRERGQPGTEVVAEPLPCDFAMRPRKTATNFGGKRILVVSTLDAHKNHERFLESCNLLWNDGMAFSVDLIGRSSGQSGQRIQVAVNALKQAGRPIEWRAQVDEAGLIEAYRRSSFTVYPSMKEGFGLPILESLWHGKPCICGSNGAIGEVASGGGCLTVDQADPASLASGMRLLLDDREAYTRLYDESLGYRFRTWPDYARAIADRLSLTP